MELVGIQHDPSSCCAKLYSCFGKHFVFEMFLKSCDRFRICVCVVWSVAEFLLVDMYIHIYIYIFVVVLAKTLFPQSKIRRAFGPERVGSRVCDVQCGCY